MRPNKRALAIAAVVIVGALYFTGRLDHALYNVGLNFHTCARNGFGAVFCGSELTDYQNRIRGVQQQFQNTERTITQQEQQAQQTVQQQEQQYQQQAQQEQQTLTQQECQADPHLSFCSP